MQRTVAVSNGDEQAAQAGLSPEPDALASLMVRVATRQDRTAFAALFGHFAPRLKSFYLARRVDESFAEDLVQETMLVLWQRANEYCPERAAVSTWLFTIARNLSIDRLRRERRYDPQTPPEDALSSAALTPDAVREPEPEEVMVVGEREGALRQAMKTLPEDQRKVIEMHYQQWMTTGEIARTEALSQGTVKSRMRLALRRLRSELEAY